MIIFDLDGTLADCEHRRHFVDPNKREDLCFELDHIDSHGCPLPGTDEQGSWHYADNPNMLWKPDWKSFYEACRKDSPIEPLVDMWNNYEVETACCRVDLQIWSGRCESVRQKTLAWLDDNLFGHNLTWWDSVLKMRPIGDNTPDDQLKERWYNIHNIENPNRKIDFVVDACPKSIAMWRRRGIFVFDVNQHSEKA